MCGINPYGADKLQGLGMKTPGRTKNGEIDEDDLATPMSTYSDSDRAPIGIMSMRKLVGSNMALQPREDDDSDDIDDELDVENLSMKKLEY